MQTTNLDQLRHYQARKQKAEALPDDVRARYGKEYAKVCNQVEALTVEVLADVVEAVHGSESAELQAASGEVATAYLEGGVERLIAAVERFADMYKEREER